ncbi:hypothetical protein [Streptomyces sp. SID8352]|uniref:hypothetical protein n=1 Tax=Streptomyces sp. SID8352 TaxID=2690338 RepID=UPI0013710408|nr:hypothetical protein [Streptomyces sp. SID8352]MYU22929.1 hypothetical protein [Streptomyces sp. SID8352]
MPERTDHPQPTPSPTQALAVAVIIGTALALAPIPAEAAHRAADAFTLPAPEATPEPTPAPEPEPTPVLNYDNDGLYWGAETIAATEALIARERAAGTAIDEWNVTDRDGQPLRIVRCADPDFLDTICVIPGEPRPAVAA